MQLLKRIFSLIFEKSKLIWNLLNLYLLIVAPLLPVLVVACRSLLNVEHLIVAYFLLCFTCFLIFLFPFLFVLAYAFSYKESCNLVVVIIFCVFVSLFLPCKVGFFLSTVNYRFSLRSILGDIVTYGLISMFDDLTLPNFPPFAVLLPLVAWFPLSLMVICKNYQIKKFKGKSSRYWYLISNLTNLQELRSFKSDILTEQVGLVYDHSFWDSYKLKRAELKLIYRFLFFFS